MEDREEVAVGRERLLQQDADRRIGPVGPKRMPVVAIKRVDKMTVADPARSLESFGLSLEEPSAFKAVHLQIDHDLDLRSWSDAFIVPSPPGWEWAHHNEPAAVIHVQTARNEARASKPAKRLGNEVKVPVLEPIKSRECSCQQRRPSHHPKPTPSGGWFSSPCRWRGPRAKDGSDPAKPKAKTFVWRSQDLETILGAKLDDVGDLGYGDRAVDLLHGQHEVQIMSRSLSLSFWSPSLNSGRSEQIVQHTSERVGGGTFGRVGANAARAGSAGGFDFGSGLADAPDSRMKRWFGTLPTLPRGRAAISGGGPVTRGATSMGPNTLPTSSSSSEIPLTPVVGPALLALPRRPPPHQQRRRHH